MNHDGQCRGHDVPPPAVASSAQECTRGKGTQAASAHVAQGRLETDGGSGGLAAAQQSAQRRRDPLVRGYSMGPQRKGVKGDLGAAGQGREVGYAVWIYVRLYERICSVDIYVWSASI